jgi:N-sulfoglucosamine sulfohydrolase
MIRLGRSLETFMTRRSVVVLGLSNVLLAFISSAAAAAEKNVVLMIADDLGRELGCYGDKAAKTPNIDRLAAEGTRFTHAFCTTASCSPSRSVMFTGLHNHANGQYGLAHAEHNFFQRPGVVNVFQIMKGAGWRTGIIGKKHVQPEGNYKVDFQPRVNARNPVAMGRQAREFFGKAGQFFAVIGFTDPHRARSNFANDGQGAPKPPVFFKPEEVNVPPYLPDVDAVRADWADYYAAVTRLDQGVGEVMKALKESGKENDTLVVFISDNGPPFPGAKCGLYDAGVNLPMIVRKPGGKSNATCSAMTTWCDLAPTLLEWVGGTMTGLHGSSVLGALDGKEIARDEAYFSHTFHEITMYYPMRAVRTRTHKLIWNLAHELPFPIAQDQRDSPSWQYVAAKKPPLLGKRSFDSFARRPEFELYELTTDPEEVHNRAADPAMKPVLDDLLGRIKKFQTATRDPFAGGISRPLD